MQFKLGISQIPSDLIICHAYQESTTLLYSLNCISESFAFLSQIPRVKPLLRIWMHPLSLYMILHDIKRLYAMRWGIETSFRNLKHTLGLLHLHAKKVEFVLQEIFAKLTMYNFCELITQSVVIRQTQKTHTYKVNFSDAVHICRQFFLGDVPPPILEAMLMRYISPIRPGRKDTRKLTQKSSASFTYHEKTALSA